jgi:hypothetical protein
MRQIQRRWCFESPVTVRARPSLKRLLAPPTRDELFAGHDGLVFHSPAASEVRWLSMADELLTLLTRVHREVVLPDIERVLDDRMVPLRDEMLSNFDAVFKHLDRLEMEYHALTAAVRRIEERIALAEQQFEKLALRSELEELRHRVHDLEQRITDLQAQI